jgi:FkbM family methyltransferase
VAQDGHDQSGACRVIATATELKFVGETQFERYRAKTLWTKEPGTIQWLRQNCREGDRVYDIGANIGCYTLVAAQLVGEHGRVWAFEPHVGTAHSLLQNIRANDLSGRVRVITAPLHNRVGFRDFSYGSMMAGSSDNQVDSGRLRGAHELKYALTLDQFDAADLVKIDVDGNELKILQGGKQFFTLAPSPRSVQIEIPPVDAAAITALMQDYGYTLERIHYTMQVQQQINAGKDPLTVIHNAIFRKVTV